MFSPHIGNCQETWLSTAIPALALAPAGMQSKHTIVMSKKLPTNPPSRILTNVEDVAEEFPEKEKGISRYDLH